MTLTSPTIASDSVRGCQRSNPISSSATIAVTAAAIKSCRVAGVRVSCFATTNALVSETTSIDSSKVGDEVA